MRSEPESFRAVAAEKLLRAAALLIVTQSFPAVSTAGHRPLPLFLRAKSIVKVRLAAGRCDDYDNCSQS